MKQGHQDTVCSTCSHSVEATASQPIRCEKCGAEIAGQQGEVPPPDQGEENHNGAKVAAVAGAVGAAAGVAAPVAVVAGVQAIGFGTAGITGGSIAASLMSASAVASGGGVAAGGTIATLQAIGATASVAVIGGPVTIAVGGMIIVGGTAAGLAYGGYKLWNWRKAKTAASL